MNISRRSFLLTSASLSFGVFAGSKGVLSFLQNKSTQTYELIARPFELKLIKGKTTTALGYNGAYPGTVVRCRQGDILQIKFINQLQEQSTIHWHGMRVPLEMDGVPYLSQLPVLPGEYFNYEFKCLDAGNFWYHPHEGSTEQMGRGLAGAVIVDEIEPTEFQAEQILILKNWNIDEDGNFLPFYTRQTAIMGGARGRLPSVNGKFNPTLKLPENQIVRLRVFNMDNTLTYALNIKNAEAKIYSIDGHPLPKPYLLTEDFLLAAGQRIDIALRVPKVGTSLVLRNKDQSMVVFEPTPSAKKSHNADDWPNPLPPNPVIEPDISKAELIPFSFGWINQEVTDDTYQFWKINEWSWDVKDITCVERPIYTLKHNQHYIFEFKNNSPFEHPIHLHGLVFKVFASDKKTIIPHFADTYLLEAFETAKVALVADRIGTWMIHCHVLEHLDTGMMAAIKIE